MTSFTNQQMDSLRAEAADLLHNVEEGQSARQIMVQLYISQLEGKSASQGELIADDILQNVREFDAGYQAAQKDLDGFIARFQEQVDQGKTCAQRCEYWLKLSTAVTAATAAMGEGDGNYAQLLEELENTGLGEDEATPEKEAQLRQQAAEALKNSGVMLYALTEQAEELEKLDQAEEAAGMLISLGSRELEYRGIVAMLAYVKIKQGAFPDVPVDMTAAQVATLVCAQVEQSRIMESVGKGNLAVDVAALLLAVLGAVVLVRLFLSLSVAALGFAASTFGLILAVPACLVVLTGVLYLFGRALDGWIYSSNKIVQGAVLAVRTVLRGIKAVVRFVKERVLPQLLSLSKAVLAKLRTLVSGRQSVEVSVDG